MAKASADIGELRYRYLAIGCGVVAGSRASDRLGPGVRILYLVACDGQELVAYDAVGRGHKLRREDLTLKAVYNESGKNCRFRLEDSSGHLLVLVGVKEDQQTGEEVEQWYDTTPWAKYAPEAAEAVQEASRAVFGGRGGASSGPATLEAIFQRYGSCAVRL